MDERFNHHEYLQDIANGDVQYLVPKDTSYGASWKLSGGRSAWFMLRRKMDRMLEMMRRPDPPTPNFSPHAWGMPADPSHVRHLAECYNAEDIFAKIAEDPSGRDGCVLAEVRDLRRYLLLVEAEMVARGTVVDVVGTNQGPPPEMMDRSAPIVSPPGARVSGNGAERLVPRHPPASARLPEGDGWDRRPGHDGLD